MKIKNIEVLKIKNKITKNWTENSKMMKDEFYHHYLIGIFVP